MEDRGFKSWWGHSAWFVANSGQRRSEQGVYHATKSFSGFRLASFQKKEDIVVKCQCGAHAPKHT